MKQVLQTAILDIWQETEQLQYTQIFIMMDDADDIKYVIENKSGSKIKT